MSRLADRARTKVIPRAGRGRHSTRGERPGAESGLPPPVLDRLADGLVVLDAQGRVRFVNRAARQMLGLGSSASGRLGRDVVRTVVPGEDLISPALSGRRSETETLLVTARGDEVPVRASLVPLGPRSGAVAVLTDLTKTRRLEQELRRRERLSLMGQLSAGVAHEVRNPLAGISSSAQVLLGRFEPRDERTRFVRAILDEVSRLDRIVTELLQFARPSEPRLRRGSLPDTLQRLLDTTGEWLSDAGVEIETAIAAKVPDAWFDPDLIHQVLLNLVSNAVQAMPRGGRIRFEIRPRVRRGLARGIGRRKDDPGRRARSTRPPASRVVQVRVSDTGEGIPREHLSRLFDPFFTTKPSGTGLGLSICQSIVQEHGGSIHVASRRGHGTTVLVELPIEKRQGERRSA